MKNEGLLELIGFDTIESSFVIILYHKLTEAQQGLVNYI